MTKKMAAKVVDFLVDLGFGQDYPFGYYLDQIHIEVSNTTIALSRDRNEMIKNILIDTFNSGFEEGKQYQKNKFAEFTGLNKIEELVHNLENRLNEIDNKFDY